MFPIRYRLLSSSLPDWVLSSALYISSIGSTCFPSQSRMRDNMRDDLIQTLRPCHHEMAAAETSMETHPKWGNVVAYLILAGFPAT
jgi:hypothetical protein